MLLLLYAQPVSRIVRLTIGDALRPSTQNLDRHPDYVLAAYMASAT